MELSDNQRLYLQAIFDYFHEHGKWPTYRYIDRKLTHIRRDLDIEEISKSLPPGFATSYAFNHDLKAEAVLSTSAISFCKGSEDDLADFVKALIFCAERYFNGEEDVVEVSSDDIARHLDMSDLSVHKVGLLIKDAFEYPIYQVFGGKDSEYVEWNCTLSRNIRYFDGVETIEQYLEKLNKLKNTSAQITVTQNNSKVNTETFENQEPTSVFDIEEKTNGELVPTDIFDEILSIDHRYPYDVALSFAGEDRTYADDLATALRQSGLSVFYDAYEKSTLWGKNLYTYLSEIYRDKAHFCVMFISKHYADKLWTNHEREAAQARAFKENTEYILPIRLDDTEIPGILQTTAHLNWHEETINTIVNMLLEKLGKSIQHLPETASVERKFAYELPGEYEKRMQLQMVGILDFRQAINNHDWKQAEKVLQKYPNLPEARSLLGLSISKDVQAYFFHELHPEIQGLGKIGGPVTPMYLTQVVQIHPTPLKLEAIHWLEEALQYQDNPEYQVTTELALMYGYSKVYDRMIDTLQELRTINSALISYFKLPEKLLMLIYACNDLASIKEVMRIVDMELPRKDGIQQLLREASDPKKNPYALVSPFVEWYAIELGKGNTSKMPVKVRIVFPNEKGLTYAQVFKQRQASITIPLQATTSGIIDTLISVDEILNQLTDNGFVFVTPS